MTDLRNEAMMADSYELTQRDSGFRGKLAPYKKYFVDSSKSQKGSDPAGRPTNRKFYRTEKRNVVCHYWKKPGHMKSNCRELEMKNIYQAKTMALIRADGKVEPQSKAHTCPYLSIATGDWGPCDHVT